MAAVLSAILKGEDNLSSIFDRIANSGGQMIEKWQQAGNTASAAFAETTSSADIASKAMENAAASTDHWTAAVGNYDKSALEAVHTTAELVEMGFKTEDALTSAADGADDAATAFNKAVQEAENFKETTAQLEAELQELQNAYVGTALQKGKNSKEARALQAEIAALSEVINENKRELDDLTGSAGGAETGVSSMASKIEKVLVAAGIAKLIGKITAAVKEMTNEFSNAESTIIRASGASGRELDGFRESMFNVFATARSGDLSLVATAITEVNTRLGLQGAELEHVTRLFMDYADMNGTNVTSSIQTLSQVMTRWNVDASQTERLLDRITFAGQQTGISVDELSYNLLKNQASFDALGFSIEESIALMAALEAGGINTQAAMYGLRRVVNYSAKDGKDAGEAFREIIEDLQNMENRADATARAVEVFGVRAGQEMAVAIQSGKFEIDAWVDALGTADGTLASTAAAATTLEERWTQASNQMSVAFSSALSPALTSVSGGLADLKMGVGEFLADNPAVVAVLSGLAVGFMAVAGGLAIYKLAMTIGTVVTAVFGTTLSVALWPLTLIVLAIAAVTAGFILLFNWIGSANREFNELTATSKEHHEAVTDLRREYERATLVYGENSDEVRRLAGELEAAELVFEANRRTMEEVIAVSDNLIERHRRMADSFYETMENLDREERSAAQLIGRLADLSSQTDLTAAEQLQMSTIVGELNSRFPEMSLAIDEVTGSLNMSVEAMRAMAQAQHEQQQNAAQHQAFIDSLGHEADLRAQLADLLEIQAAAQRRYDESGGGNLNPFDWSYRNARNDLQEATDDVNRLQAAIEEQLAIQAQAEEAWERQAQAAKDAANAAVSYEDAVSRAIRAVASDVEILAQLYQEAFDAAHKSISGQFDLWDRAAEVVPKSIYAVTSAMESQMAHWQAYNENLAGLTARSGEIEGLAELINSFADGSDNSVAMIAGMAEATDEELAAMVEGWKALQAEQDAVAHSIAELATDFSNGMDEIEARMHEAINNMNMEDDAARAARATASAYVQAFATEMRNLNSVATLPTFGADLTISRGYATGTDFAAPGLALVGEEGPELVNFRGGEVVYTAEETRQIFTNTPTEIHTGDKGLTDRFGGGLTPAAYRGREEKRIILDITGRGEIDVTGGADEETVWDYVAPKLRDAVFGIMRDEIFEEGDVAHAF